MVGRFKKVYRTARRTWNHDLFKITVGPALIALTFFVLIDLARAVYRQSISNAVIAIVGWLLFATFLAVWWIRNKD